MRYTLGFLLMLMMKALPSEAEIHRCSIEIDASIGEHCIFRNVQISGQSTDISFESPPESSLPSRITFENSSMTHLPMGFLQKFGDSLKVLKVEGCMLRVITITTHMEALFARNNYISKVIIPHSNLASNIRELDLSANRLKDTRNITRCPNLEVLNLSSNEALATESTIDLSAFAVLKQLRELNLSDVGAFYLDNRKDFEMPVLEILDLSKNRLLPSDLQVDRLSKLKALKILKLNDNNMAELDYGELSNIPSLRTVYLNGNDFTCDKLQTMLKFLNEKYIATPTYSYSSCQSHQQKVEGMCCSTPMFFPTKPLFTSSRPTQSSTTPIVPVDSDSGSHTKDQPPGIADKGNDAIIWGAVAAVIIIAISIAVGGFLLYRKRART